MKSSPKSKTWLSFMISNRKQEMNSTIYPVPKNDSANGKANEEHVQYGCLKRTWNFLRIGEKFHETFRLFTIY